MLHRIEVDVIDVLGKIVPVAQRVLPIPPLPNPALGFGGAAGGDAFAAGQAMREAAFDQAPPLGEIRIAFRQGPGRVQVIRQDDGGFDREGVPGAHVTKHAAQQADMAVNGACRRSARLTVKK